jgi:cellulose synthase/poly-beta-1,6-N-acetylglucosamine synthase-like glycosyltransferase
MFPTIASPPVFPQSSSRDETSVLPVILNATLSICAALLLVPVAVLTIEVVAAVCGRRMAFPASGARTPVAILIPAHDEEGGISATLRSIAPQLGQHDRLIVVADNCTDGTRNIAEAEGAEVVSRTNLEKRGKGFALDFGLRHLRSNPPDIVIVVDADCHVAPGAIDHLAKVCANYRRPVQAQYLMQSQQNAGLRMRIAEFAWVVKNLVRPMGLGKLGLPCQLMGSGMAFPWISISNMDLADAHIVEDLKMGLDMARLGVPPIFCPEALVLSSFPTHEEGIRDQRTRWEHGHLGTILSEAPRVFLQGLKEMDFSLIALALDLCVPPLALLLMQVLVFWVVAAIFYAATGYRAPLLIMSAASVIFGLAVLTAWVSHGRRIISFSSLLSASLYPLWKIPMYVRFVFSRQSEWVRSKRDKDR